MPRLYEFSSIWILEILQYTHTCVHLGEFLPMLGLSHKSVNLGMDTHSCGMGHMIIYATLITALCIIEKNGRGGLEDQ